MFKYIQLLDCYLSEIFAYTRYRWCICSAIAQTEADQPTNATAASILSNLLKNSDSRIRPNIDGTSRSPVHHKLRHNILSKTCAIAGGPVSVAVGFYIVSFGSISEVDMVSVDAQLQLSGVATASCVRFDAIHKFSFHKGACNF